jgi:hypothetical protein
MVTGRLTTFVVVGALALMAVGGGVWPRRLLDAIRSWKNTLGGWACALGTVFFLDTIVSSALLFALFHASTSAEYAHRFFLREAHDDSWSPMLDALDHLHRSTAIPLYSQLFFREHVKFQYPPSSLVFVDALARLTGASNMRLIVLLNRLSWCEVVLVAVASWRLFLGALREDWPGELPDFRLCSSLCMSLASWLALAVGFYPLTRGYMLGQAQTTITLLVACALLSWQTGRPKLAGVLIGLCCCLKPQWVVMCIWALVRREWSLAVAAATTLTVVSLVACAAYGPLQYVDYLSVISFLSRRGESFCANQSMNGLMNRLLMIGSNTLWPGGAFPAFNRLVYWTTMASTVLILGAAIVWRRGRKTATIDVALVILSLTMASPIAWEHHYAVLLPIFALLLPICIAQRPFGRYTSAYLATAFFLTSQRLDLTNALAATHANFLQSYLYFGAFMVLIVLYRTSAVSDVSDDVTASS